MNETYLDIIKKYPQTKEDMLELRRNKNKALMIVFIGSLIFGALIMYVVK